MFLIESASLFHWSTGTWFVPVACCFYYTKSELHFYIFYCATSSIALFDTGLLCLDRGFWTPKQIIGLCFSVSVKTVIEILLCSH